MRQLGRNSLNHVSKITLLTEEQGCGSTPHTFSPVAHGLTAGWRKILGVLIVPLESLSVTFLKELCWVEMAAAKSHRVAGLQGPHTEGDSSQERETVKVGPGPWRAKGG